MDIGQAIQAIKSGAKVTRPAWGSRWIGLKNGTIFWGNGEKFERYEAMFGAPLLLLNDYKLVGKVKQVKNKR